MCMTLVSKLTGCVMHHQHSMSSTPLLIHSLSSSTLIHIQVAMGSSSPGTLQVGWFISSSIIYIYVLPLFYGFLMYVCIYGCLKINILILILIREYSQPKSIKRAHLTLWNVLGSNNSLLECINEYTFSELEVKLQTFLQYHSILISHIYWRVT